MKQPNFKDYETLQEYAKAMSAYKDYQELERIRLIKEKEAADLKQAEIDFNDQYPEITPLLTRSGFYHEFVMMNNGFVHVYLYEPKANQSFATLQMKFVGEIYKDGVPNDRWMVVNHDDSEDIVEYIMTRAKSLKVYDELPF